MCVEARKFFFSCFLLARAQRVALPFCLRAPLIGILCRFPKAKTTSRLTVTFPGSALRGEISLLCSWHMHHVLARFEPPKKALEILVRFFPSDERIRCESGNASLIETFLRSINKVLANIMKLFWEADHLCVRSKAAACLPVYHFPRPVKESLVLLLRCSKLLAHQLGQRAQTPNVEFFKQIHEMVRNLNPQRSQEAHTHLQLLWAAKDLQIRIKFFSKISQKDKKLPLTTIESIIVVGYFGSASLSVHWCWILDYAIWEKIKAH